MALQPFFFDDFAPDLDPITPGACQDMGGVYPVMKGYRTLPPLGRAITGLPSTCYGLFGTVLIATPKIFGATVNQLYVADSNNIFQPQGLNLSNTGNRWRGAAFGQDFIMVDGVDVPYYYRLSNGNFQALPGSPPVSALVETTDFAVILVPPNSQTFYSNVADTASWTPNAAAEVYQIAIDSTEGNITGVHRLRSGVAFYKQNAIHFASFVGGLIGWDIAIVSMTVGAAGNECVVAVGDYHYIWGPDDFWQFDGYNLTRMPNNLKEWVFRDLDQAYVQNIAGRYDVQRDLVFWHYPSTSASPRGTLDSYICTYLRTGKWAFGRLTIDLPMVGEMPAPLHTETTPDPAIAMPDHNVYIYDDLNTGVITSGVYITSNDFGDRQFMYQTRRIRPGFSTYPVPGASGAPPVRVTPMVQMTTTGTTPVSGDQVAISDDGWVNLMVTGRLTRFKVNFYGTAETAQGVIDINRLGEV